MLVYHGTDSISADNILKNGIDLTCSRESVDNGPGFYMTPNLEFARRRAASVTKGKNVFEKSDCLPAVVEIEFQLSQGDTISVMEFKSVDASWRKFVVFNRLGLRFLKDRNLTDQRHNLDSRYDIVIDPTADTGVAQLVSHFRYVRDISDLYNEISQINVSEDSVWDKQISIHTQKAITLCIGQMRILPVDTE